MSKKQVTDPTEVEQIAHQLVTQVMFHEGIPNNFTEKLKALNAINSAVNDFKTWFSHLALPNDPNYSKEASIEAEQKPTVHLVEHS